MKMVCPTHNVKLIRRQTQYGARWSCDEPGCTVRCWEGSTSTPCDQQTADARHAMHELFDPLWKSGQAFAGRGKNQRRRDAYGWLAKRLEIPVEEMHFGMFTLEQCGRARAIIEAMVESKSLATA